MKTRVCSFSFLAAALCGGLAACGSSRNPPADEDTRDADVARPDARASLGGAGGTFTGTGGAVTGGSGTGGAGGDATGGRGVDAAVSDGSASGRDGGLSLTDGPANAEAGHDAGAKGAPIKLFLDTDLVIDPGDMGCLAMLHGLADRCDIEIIGITAVTTDKGAAGTIDATDRYYGRPDIPLGVLKGDKFLDGSPYASRVASTFPNDFKDGSGAAPDATVVFRRVLAAQPDASVSVVAIGPLRNLRNFVESGPDGASPLSGRDLIAKKVKLLSVMGGHFQSASFQEWNVQQDVGAAQTVVAKWPGAMVWAGFEAGIGFQPDIGIIAKRPKSPVTFALLNAGGNSGARPGWDQTALLYAARPQAAYWKLSSGGKISVHNDASTEWQAQANGQQMCIRDVDGTKASATDLAGVTVGKYGNISAIMDDLEASAGRVGACKPASSQAAKD